MLKGMSDILIEKSLRFIFKASNNQAKYEALIAGISTVREMGMYNLRVSNDSQLFRSQVVGEYQSKKSRLVNFLQNV